MTGTRYGGPASAPDVRDAGGHVPAGAAEELAAIAGAGVINLIWEPNSEADLAGYIVLRRRTRQVTHCSR